MASPHPVLVVAYDPRWPALFEQERARLEAGLGALCLAVEHVGSTAVPGLAAKPVIDIALGIPSLDRTEELVEKMVAMGYGYVPQFESAMPTRRYFHRPSYAAHTHHVHAWSLDELRTRPELAFRDYLRAHADTAAEYAALKRHLAERFREDREGYTLAKGDFIRAVVERARAR